MLQRLAVPVIWAGLAGLCWAQGVNTSASKDDWEEINFEFNSSVLVDGFPSLLRIAELLQKNPDFKVRVEGHTDRLGTNQYNDKLGLARANAVRDFLTKYGARPDQVTTGTRGEVQPKVPGSKSTYSRTDEARWMNRRVVLTVTDGQGKVVSAGSAGEAIRAMEQRPAPRDCCDEILKRLDRLDEIAKMLKDLADQNAALRKEIEGLKKEHADMASKLQAPAPAPVQPPTVAAAPPTPPPALKDSPFQLLGINLGPDSNGDVTFTGRGRFFAPFGRGFAFQAQGEYLYFRTQREGQLDFGLVDRVGRRFQAGVFGSFKHVTLRGNQSGGTLGQASLVLDYIFGLGRVGVFGTKGFLDNATIDRRNEVSADGTLRRNIVLERYLKIVDQAGVSATLPFVGRSYIETNAGYLKSFGYGDRFGGTMRFVVPMTDKIAFTAEGGVNETMLGRGNSGRAVFGLQFGSFQKPREYLESDKPIPADVPRLRYEVLERRLRIGNDAPVADAGADQIGLSAGPVTLDGSNSYDPDGDPITFQWIQEAGPLVPLAGALTARTTFTAAEGQSYAFRLIVRDNQGAQGVARVRITTRSIDRVQILLFAAVPTTITAGASSELNWRVLNADSVEISGVGPVASQGSTSVTPSVTSTYRLVARNSVSEDSAQVTVTVITPQARVVACFASPTTINSGQSSTLTWVTENATNVNISSGVGDVPLNGSINVRPTQTTTYVVTARNATGSSTCSATVTVTPVAMPIIVRFSATPATIDLGQSSTLQWNVENASTVTITSLGEVPLTGTRAVTPQQTTTYTLTATNASGSSTATATVTVNPPPPGPEIISFTATPPNSPAQGAQIHLACSATNAVSLTIHSALFLGNSATYEVFPLVDTVYTCIATGRDGRTATATLLVRVPPPPIVGPGTPPPVIAIDGAPLLTTNTSAIVLNATARGSGPFQFAWTSRNSAARIVSPYSPTPFVELTALGDYVFDLVVTDSVGNRSTASITVRRVAQ